MTIKDNNQLIKTLGTQATTLLLGLYEIEKRTFTLADASGVIGLQNQSLRNLIHRLLKKGMITRLSSGLYTIVPFELGYTQKYLGNPYVVAREISQKKFKKKPAQYYISHSSAMDIHQMVTQPQLIMYTTVTQQIREHQILGTQFHFVTCKLHHYFGYKKHWIDKFEMVLVSDLEKTILDCLKMPQYCGGITEIAKGFWMKRTEIDPRKLLDYAQKLNVGAVYQRLGYLLEIYEINCGHEIQLLQKKITKTYLLLDPTLPDEGKYNARWRLRLNILKEELLSIIRT